MEKENEFQGDDQWLYDQQAKEEKVGILGEVEVSFGEEIDESLVEKLDKAIKTDPRDFLGKSND